MSKLCYDMSKICLNIRNYDIVCQKYVSIVNGCAFQNYVMVCQKYGMVCQKYGMVCQKYVMVCQKYVMVCQKYG